MFKRNKNFETESPELGGIAQASDELSAALKEFDERAETWARVPKVDQVART
jgi:hypothetical protein